MSERNPLGDRLLLAIIALMVGILFLTPIVQPAFADSSQVTSSVNLQNFAIQVQYPSIVMPGVNVLVQIRASAKSSFNLNSLNTQVYYADGSNLHQLSSATIASNQYVSSGNTFTQNVQVSIPQNMPRTSLFATFTESVKLSYVSSYSYYGSYNSYYPSYGANDYACSSYPAYGYNYMNYSSYYYNNQQYYCYYYPSYNSNYNYNSYNSNPVYSYYSTSDTAISSLSYVNATTPEYNSLLNQYQNSQQQLGQSQSQNQNLQQQVSQLQTQNRQLQQNLQNAQNQLSQTASDNSNLNSQLNTTKTTNRYLEYLAGALGLIAVLAAVLGHRTGRPKKTQSVNPYAANYAPGQNRPESYP